MSKHSRWKATNTVPIRFRIFSILGLFLWIFSQLCSALDGGSSPFVLQNILLINHEPNKISLGVWEHGDFSQSLKSPLNSEFGYQARSVQGRAWIKRSHALSFDEAVARLFRELGLHEAIAIKTTDFLPFGPSTPNLPSVRQGSSLDHRFFFQGIPLCDFHARSHRLNDGSGLVMGDLPALEFIDLYRSFEDWPDLVITQSLVESSLDFAPRDDPSHVDNPTENPEKNEHLLTAEKCFHVAQHNILPTWMMTVRLRNGLIYAVLADEHHIYRLRPQFFSVNGTAKTWAHNRSTAPEAERILYDLVGDGTLKSEFLKTVVPIEFPPVQEPNHTFNYDINDRRIEEVTAYANAQDHLRWFQKLGFTWYSLKPLELRLHFSDLNNPNNANYYQGSVAKNIPPSITINDGDGIELQHLVTDGDVVGHELGHHVIYKTLRKIENDVLPLHEGLADFFVFARTGDPCLAETICPLGSKVCQMEGKCLRSADNTLTFNDEIWRGFPPVPNQKYGHRHGQLISGMLWDLQKSGRFAKDDLAIMVLKATSFFAEYADFCQFIKALYAADREIFANQHESSIRDAALKRGFYEFADPTQNCSEILTKAATQTSESKTTDKKKSGSLCGVVGKGSGSPKKTPLEGSSSVFLILVPCLLISLRKHRSHGSKQKIVILCIKEKFHENLCLKAENLSTPRTITTGMGILSFMLLFSPPWITADASSGASLPVDTQDTVLPLSPPGSSPDVPAPTLNSGKKLVQTFFSSQTATEEEAVLTISLMIQWEGRPISPENIEAVENLRRAFPKLDMVHLISPAYFSRSPAEANEALRAIQRIVLPRDSYGVLLGSWKSVVAAADVIFRSYPTFWGSALTEGQCQSADCGVDIPLHLYPSKDLEKIIKYSVDTLTTKVLGRPRAFAVTGWVSSNAVLESASQNGLIYDFSPVAPEMLAATLHYYPLYGWIKSLWQQIRTDSMATFHQTAQGRMLLYPQVLASVDHQPHGTIVNHVSQTLSQWNSNQTEPANRIINLPIVMYLETAAETAPRIQRELRECLNIAEQNKVKIHKQTFSNLQVPPTLADLRQKILANQTADGKKNIPERGPPHIIDLKKENAH